MAVACVALLSGCVSSGERAARDEADRIVDEIADDLSPAYPRPHEADYLAEQALTAVRDNREGPVRHSVVAVDWWGNSGEPEGASITIRVAVEVDEKSGSLWGGGVFGHDAGASTRCWVLTVYGFRNYDTLERREIGCSDRPLPPRPDPGPLPELPPDTEALLVAALTGATASSIDDRVRAAFPEDYYVIRSTTEGGELAVAIGIPVELECAVGVLATDGTISVETSFPKVQLQAGETGCSPDLHFHPVTTH